MKLIRSVRAMLATAALTLALAAPALAQDDALEDLPGFVDFGPLDQVYGEPIVQVALAEPLLNFVQAIAREEDPDAADLFANLRGIRVQIYDVGTDPGAALDTMRDVAGRLQADDWASVVRVRNEGDRVDVFMRMEGENIEGITVMVAGDDNEAVFVNIIGSLRPDQLARVMDTVDVDGVDIQLD